MNTQKLALAALVSLCLTLAVTVSAAPAAGACPNEALRTGFNAYLPECRAYELVSPPGTPPELNSWGKAKDSEDIRRPGSVSVMQGEPQGVNVSASGERLAFFSNYAPSSSSWDSQYFIASRGQQGWSTSSLVPPQSPEHTITCHNAYAVAYSTELTSWVLGDGWGQPGDSQEPGYHTSSLEGCGKDEPELVHGEPQGSQNLFVSEGLNAPSQLVDVTPEGSQPADAWFQAASANLEHVVFDERANLTPEAPFDPEFPGALDLYVWTKGAVPAVRLVTILPDGMPTEGVLVNRTLEQTVTENYTQEVFFHVGPEIYTHTVSSDGDRVFFTANGNLYVREKAYAPQSELEGEHCTEPEKACTVQVDAAQPGGEGGGGTFMWASADGLRVFFTDTRRLTASSTAAPEAPDLYEYDFKAPEGVRLTDLTANATEPADVQGVSGLSEDGSYVYFVANGKLTNTANSHNDTAIAGQPNLYVAHAGEVAFIATLDPTYDSMDWSVKVLTSRVSENGRYIAFDSQRELTGYDNTPAQPADCVWETEPRPCTEIFLYDAQQRQLSCVSCQANGAPPTAPAGIGPPEIRAMDYDELGGATAPGYLRRNITDNGQVFFDTSDPLSSRATNGLTNAYEYRNGEVRLLTTATSNVGAFFYEGSASGNDVFVTTNQPLAAGAEGSEYSIYDVRVNGGFSPPEPATACSEEDCRGAITPTPLLGAPSSQTLVAQGNAVYNPPVYKTVKVKKHNKTGKHKRRGRRNAKRRQRERKGKKARRAMRAVRRDRGGVR